MALVGPFSFLCGGHYGVSGGAPQLFCTLQDVAAFELVVGYGEEVEGDLAVFCGVDFGGCHVLIVLVALGGLFAFLGSHLRGNDGVSAGMVG